MTTETPQFTAGDMASAAADGFRAGQASKEAFPEELTRTEIELARAPAGLSPTDRLELAAKLIGEITVVGEEEEIADLAIDLQHTYQALLQLNKQLGGKSVLSTEHHIAESAGNALRDICYGRAANAGWWIDTETGEDVRTWPKKFFSLWVSAKLALVHSEVSEGLEGHRKGLPDDKLPHRLMLEVELADAVIRVFDLAGGLGMDIGGAIAEKLHYNSNRPDHKIENRLAEGGKSF